MTPKSIRIQKHNRGKVTGYWKGITSSEAQDYTYTVGIKDTDSSSSVANSASELNKSLETGYNGNVSAEAKASFMGIGAGLGGSAGMHKTSKSAAALKQSLQ